MLLHPGCTNILVIEAIVPFLQGQCMIPYKAGLPEHLIEVLRLGSPVEFVFVCNHKKTVILLANI